MLTSADRAARLKEDAPRTLAEAPPRRLGLADQAALWGNLGITLTIPVAAAFVLRPSSELPPLTLAAAVAAVVLGTAIGSLVLALSAVPGAETGAPAMVLLRGLLGRRGSWAPTLLNIAQCVGWAAVEILVIADGAAKLFPSIPRALFVIGAGATATALALRPLGFVHRLRRYAVWLVLVATAYLFYEVVRRGPVSPAGGSWRAFLLSVDVVVALPISWAPLAADYSRHSRRPRDAFGGALGGFGLAATAYFLLGVLAVSAIPEAGADPIGALLALPAGALAIGILILDEMDEAFANLYSTALSMQNLQPALDRRHLAVAVGAVATALGLVANITHYENFLFLIGSVFIPLFAVLLVDYYLLQRRTWNAGPLAPSRPIMVVPWLLGFVAYQLLNPGTVPRWSELWARAQAALHLSPPPVWLSASLTSFAVAALSTLLVAAARYAGRVRAG
jgi:nucleobase:cation symporter-1, NCS1 family